MIDTGFNGSLCLPASFINELALDIVSEVEIFGVGQHRQTVLLAVTAIIWFGKKIEIEVLINDGDDRLLGSELLDRNVLTVNYEKRTLTIKPAHKN